MPNPNDAGANDTTATPRPPLSRERILQSALELADRDGLEALSMRRLGRALGVEAMSLYKHVADKEDILDGITDLVMAEVDPPSPDEAWKAALRRTAIAVHGALLRHPWAGPVFESRLTPGPARLRYLDAVLGTLRGAGFDLAMTAQAFMAFDAHIYGFTMQESSWRFDRTTAPEVAGNLARELSASGHYPNVLAMAQEAASGPDAVTTDFEFGLDLLLDGLERRLATG